MTRALVLAAATSITLLVCAQGAHAATAAPGGPETVQGTTTTALPPIDAKGLRQGLRGLR